MQSNWARCLLALVALVILYPGWMNSFSLFGPDEPRYASIARAMAETGDWITPRLDGEPWLEKPPLLYWLSAIGFRAGLGPETAPRVPVALLSAAFLIWFGWFLKRWMPTSKAVLAAAVLATSAGWIAYSNVAVTDVPMSACFSAGMLLSLAWIERGRSRDAALAGALFGLAILGKGLVPIALAAPLVWFARKRWRQWPVIVLAALAVCLPWYIAITMREGWAFIDEFFLRHHFSRFASDDLQHGQPFWFYIPVLVGLTLPWTPWLFRPHWRNSSNAYFLTWLLFGLVFFSAATNKLPGYLMPLLPAAAVLVASRFAENARLPYWLSGGMTVIVLGFKLAPPEIIHPQVNAVSLAANAPADSCADDVPRSLRYGLHYYLRRPVLDCWRTPGSFRIAPSSTVRTPGPWYEIRHSTGKRISGRVLVFASTTKPGGGAVLPVESRPEETWIASREVLDWASGEPIRVDSAGFAFPGPISSAAPGRWHFTVFFDPVGDFPYYGPTYEDLRSDLITIDNFDTRSDQTHSFTVKPSAEQPPPPPTTEIPSKLLSRFHREPISIRADILPGESAERVLVLHAHGESYASSRLRTLLTASEQRQTLVFLHCAYKFGHHAFADSDTNGPWSAALLEEFIPAIGAGPSIDLIGDGLGGWAAVYLKQRFPDRFRNVWVLDPDPVDFRNFFGIDLTSRPTQAFRDAEGRRLPFTKGISIEESTIRESALGLNGGRWESWDAIYSLRSSERVSVELFSRDDGTVNQEALAAWLRYNLAAKPWPERTHLINERELTGILQSK